MKLWVHVLKCCSEVCEVCCEESFKQIFGYLSTARLNKSAYENFFLLGYFTLSVSVYCHMFWDGVMATSSKVRGPMKNAGTFGSLQYIGRCDQWKKHPGMKPNFPEEWNFQLHFATVSLTHISSPSYFFKLNFRRQMEYLIRICCTVLLLINYCSDLFLLGHLQIAHRFVLLACQVAVHAAQTIEFPAHDQGLRMKHVRTIINQ
jgi:hypothetical protein